ncbi:hypothetical protein ASG43_12215 [Aureimonas sp. Leaf454]|uniref:SIMPL domain-containing protein n=1 Tax=Aureimonas sp. Leaf454 TaxID=1736381 RepID=UPI0007005992|nr:SIMPL domain-containing protein [Aureimonas sp. Leaf454]KQT45264.1 hypothetical protein ASG43_12215 [Aureimonas sp. Leaf454]
MNRPLLPLSPARAGLRPGLLALAVLALAPAAFAEETPTAPVRQITVTGTGEASAKPDLATTGLTVLRIAPTAGEALTAASAGMTEVVAAMKALGVEPRDLQTSGFQITPQYRYDEGQDGTRNPPALTGYEVRNTLSVRIRNLDTIGALLDNAVSLGVNEGSGIQFTIDDPAGLRTEARKKAVADARSTAETLAEAAGVALGPVVSIDVAADAMPPMPMPMSMARMEMAAPKASSDGVPVEAGESTVTTNVRIVYGIAGGS